MKLDQLIEYNTKKFFLKNHIENACDGETIPRPFSEKSKLNKFLNQ